MSTELAYLDDTMQFESVAYVVSIDVPPGSPSEVIVLDSTIFYPQSGGQPTDVGTITKNDGSVFEISKVSFYDGLVSHAGTTVSGKFTSADTVELHIDGTRRMNHARLHTGGHLVMTAVDRVLGLPAVKGYHFPDGPYVEFNGTIDVAKREETLASLQALLDSLVAEDSAVTARFISLDDLKAEGVYVPSEIPVGKPTRVVITAGYKSPCGGTHVSRLGELRGLQIKSMKNKSGKTRVSYTVDNV
jgi:Ser-tRNA(Ala) deacylase AlaX